jgi:CRISPR/Cas system-associated protein Cas7 (RAMP superfamily)
MSESSGNGQYFNSSRDNDIWLQESFADIYKNSQNIQSAELNKRYNRARKFTKDQYAPWYIIGKNTSFGHFKLCPIADLGADRGFFSEIEGENLKIQMILKGSLMATDHLDNLSFDQKEYLELLMRTPYSENPIQSGKKNGTNYLAIHEEVVSGSYLVINRLFPEDLGQEAIERGLIHPEQNEKVYIKINGVAEPISFLRETSPTIIPGTIYDIKLENINGERVFT